MKKITCALFVFLSVFNIGFAAPVDNREYVDWKDYPNIVKVLSGQWSTGKGACTGTQIGKYVLTAAHCILNNELYIIRNDGTTVAVDLHSKGDINTPDGDWAILSLHTTADSQYTISTEITSDFGNTYGFGTLRILTTEELAKIREHMNNNPETLWNADKASELLHGNIPGVGYIYNDGDRLKKSPCNNIMKSGKGIEALCMTSQGNSGGGLLIDNTKIIGILSKGDAGINYGTTFTSTTNILNMINETTSGACNEDFVANLFQTRYPQHKGYEKIGICYRLTKQDGYVYLTDLCGNVLLQDRLSGSIKSVSYNKGIYTITSKPKLSIRECNNRTLNIAMNLHHIIATMPEKDIMNNTFNNIKISTDEGKTFRYVKDIPADLKKCLGIK